MLVASSVILLQLHICAYINPRIEEDGGGVRWVLGVGGKLKAGYTIHWNRNRVFVSSTKQRQPQSTC